MNFIKLLAELQSFGIRAHGKIKGRKGGAGPSEGITIFVGEENIPLNVPHYSEYVRHSPYQLVSDNGRHRITKGGVDTGIRVKIPEKPAYYSLKTSTDKEMWKIALFHGKDCIGTTLFQSCVFWRKSRGCKFCSIGLSLEKRKTTSVKLPDEIYEVSVAAKELDGAEHITITTGTQKDRIKEIRALISTSSMAKKAGLSVHVQIAPLEDEGLILQLREAGVDTIGVHIESPDEKVMRSVCPWKSEFISLYYRNWKYAVEVFGKGQVQSFIVLGLGERKEKLYDGIRKMCEMGVIPYPVPLRPVPGTPLQSLLPPSPEYLVEVYTFTVEEMKKCGLTTRNFKAGCVRCGACSLIGLLDR